MTDVMEPSVTLLACAILVSMSCASAQSALSYRWAYRNPLSITNSSATDLGEGSYNGTVNSTSNIAADSTLVLRYSHGATSAFLPNGSFAVIWQGSPAWYEGSIQQAAYWALSNDGGFTFGPARRIQSSPTGPLWGPNIHVQGDIVYMIFSGPSPPQCQYVGEGGGLAWPPGGNLQMVVSADNGETWSDPTIIFAASAEGTSAKLNIGRLATTDRGFWLLPFWRERSGPPCWGPAGAAYSGVPGVFQSTDQGQTWELVTDTIQPAADMPPTQWLIENVIVRYTAPGSNSSAMMQSFRSNSTNLWQSWSMDDGVTWTDAKPGRVRAPNSKTDMAELPDGSILMAFNDDTVARTNLSLSRSTNGGHDWTLLATLEDSPNGSFSYPTVTYMPDLGKVSVVYSVWHQPSNESAVAFGPSPTGPLTPSPSANWTAGPHRPTSTTFQPAIQANGRRLQSRAGRKPLSQLRESAGETRHRAGRDLKQVPYDQGAWGSVSYGIRIATIDVAALLGLDDRDIEVPVGGR